MGPLVDHRVTGPGEGASSPPVRRNLRRDGYRDLPRRSSLWVRRRSTRHDLGGDNEVCEGTGLWYLCVSLSRPSKLGSPSPLLVTRTFSFLTVEGEWGVPISQQ